MSRIEKVLILMVVTIVTAFSIIHYDEVKQHNKDVEILEKYVYTIQGQYDSMASINFKLVKTYGTMVDSFGKYKKLYIKSKNK